MSLDEIYSAAWFAHDFEHLQPEFDVVADSLVREFRLMTTSVVVDIGCGPGMVVKRLADLCVNAHGIEGSSHGVAYASASVRERIERCDITTIDRLPWGNLSLVICTEVAEHLDAEHADGLVALLCSALCPVVFTAAPPGQDGHHHVNCQPQEYWIEKFVARGCKLDVARSLSLKQRWAGLKRLSHMTNNVTVFS